MQKTKGTNGKSIGALIIGMIAMFGSVFIKEGTFLSIVGLLLGVMSLKETKQFKQSGRNLALAGIILNCIGLIGIVCLMI